MVKGVAIWSNFPHHIVTNIPVLLSLKNNLKTSEFLTDNAAKAKCPFLGKGSKGKMVIGLYLDVLIMIRRTELHNVQRVPPQ